MLLTRFEYVVFEYYKSDWLSTHISEENERQTMEEWAMSETILGFDDYVDENGYINGELYSSISEFLDNEYQDADYMRSLLPDSLWQEWYRINGGDER